MAIIVPFSKSKPQQNGPIPITDPFTQMALAQMSSDRKNSADGKATD